MWRERAVFAQRGVATNPAGWTSAPAFGEPALEGNLCTSGTTVSGPEKGLAAGCGEPRNEMVSGRSGVMRGMHHVRYLIAVSLLAMFALSACSVKPALPRNMALKAFDPHRKDFVCQDEVNN